MSGKQFVGYFRKFVILREGLGRYAAYNKFNDELVARGDTLQEIEFALLDIEEE